jgi:hypothetical protein
MLREDQEHPGTFRVQLDAGCRVATARVDSPNLITSLLINIYILTQIQIRSKTKK